VTKPIKQVSIISKTNVSRQTVIAIKKERYDPSLKLALKIARILKSP
jgi:DNA-binding XRE family transcriptional regulator